MSWKEVIAPAITLAEEGFAVPHDLANILASENYKRRLTSNEAGAQSFYKENNENYAAGEILVQRDLAWSLKQLRDFGPKAFYEGEIAKKIVKEMERNGGLISMEDLKQYKPVEREPVQGTFRDFKIVSMPPASSGGIHLIQMLNMLEEFPIKKWQFRYYSSYGRSNETSLRGSKQTSWRYGFLRCAF